MTTEAFYEAMTPFYHLIFADWEASIQRQAAELDSIIQEYWGQGRLTVLDVSCGIGTQALGLTALGYQVTGSDLSAREIERAKHEAAQHGLTIDFSVADMRAVFDHHRRQFGLVISVDNAVPHLLTDGDILAAFRQFYQCVKPGGGCLITVRDYETIERSGLQVKPYGIRVENGIRYLIFQVWEFSGDIYDVSMYFVADAGAGGCTTQVSRAKYYAIPTGRLMELLAEAGFVEVKRLDGRFYQPVIIGTRAISTAAPPPQ